MYGVPTEERGGWQMQTNRLFQIIYILLCKKTVSTRELADELGVSRRTIFRDIDVLSSAGVPVYTERGKGGGISILPNFILNKSILSEQEQNEILSALHGLSKVAAVENNQVLQKLSAIFNKALLDWLEVDFSSWSGSDGFFNVFKTAILEHRITQFDYYNAYGNKTFRCVEPVQLWFKSRAWYLKGFCLAKQSIRLYKLSRVKNLVVTDEHFQPRNLTAEPGEPVQENKTNYITLKLCIQPEMAYRVFDDFCESMTERQTDDSFIATATWPEDDWVYGYILSFGEYAEVLEPAHVRNIIKDKAKKIGEKYL